MSFNFIPSTDDNVQTAELPELFEFARDLKTLELSVKDDEFYFVSRNDAIKIWILKTLNMQTSRFNHMAYSNDYGNEIEKLFNIPCAESILKSELKRLIEEALYVNPYITKITDFNFKKEGSKVKSNFTVSTIYGEFDQDYEYIKE